MTNYDVRITDRAAEELQKIRSTGKTPRIYLAKSGCCSFYLVMSSGEAPQAKEEIMEIGGEPFIVSETAKPYLRKVEIDYGRSGIRKDFLFHPIPVHE